MDPSTKLSFLLGNLKVAESEINLDTWVNLLYKLRNQLKAAIDSLDYFELSQVLNDETGSFNGYYLVTDMSLVEMPPGFHVTTSFIELYRSKIDGYGGDANCARVEILLLDETGEFFHFSGDYNKTDAQDDVLTIDCTKGSVVIYDVSDFMMMFGQDRTAPMRILRTLRNAAESSVTLSYKQLGKQKAILHEVERVLMRIET